jgi:preprotein translocase YajC subunit
MRAKQLAMQKMLDELKKNDRVVTSAGIHGTVVATSPESGTVTLRIDDSTNARLTVNRNTIVRVGEVNSKE